MGVGQIKYFILIPESDKKPIAPAFPFKKAQELLVFDSLRPNDREKLRDSTGGVNGFQSFF
jgi:hypothetical protein